MPENHYSFIGGATGDWQVTSMEAHRGSELTGADRILISTGLAIDTPPDAKWVLRGFTSNVRYANGAEVAALASKQPGLNRPEASCAALIPIKKSPAWWALAQDQRRAIFEESSHHTAIGLDYLPAIARRLHHCRDLGEPFDFLTWFEFSPSDTPAFNELVTKLRSTKEWTFVDHEVDIRLERLK